MNRQEIDMMIRAEKAQLIEPINFPVFFKEWKRPAVCPRVIAAADMLDPSPTLTIQPIEPQWLDPGRDTVKQFYQDNGFVHTDEFSPQTAYEIARFYVGFDQVGIVKYCGTYLEILDEPAGTPVELEPLDPFTLQFNGVEAEFFLRLDYGVRELLSPDPFVGHYQNAPGYGFPRLSRWTDYRFAWNWTGNDVYWIVPRRHTLRLYLVIQNAPGSRLVSKALGRLMGYTQPFANLSAIRNVERGW
jgi:hypothetical protein